jgi:hypothetical protein
MTLIQSILQNKLDNKLSKKTKLISQDGTSFYIKFHNDSMIVSTQLVQSECITFWAIVGKRIKYNGSTMEGKK